MLAWERVEVCGPRLISGLVGPVAQTRHVGWPRCILYIYYTKVQYSKTIYIYELASPINNKAAYYILALN